MRNVILLATAFPLFAGDIEKLAFMAGCWTGPGTFEMWMKPDGGAVLGAGRTIKDNKVVATEFFSVSETADAVILNVQLRLAEKTTPFRAKEITESSVTFENPEHDYPQRIIYRLNTDGSLHARIEGTREGKVQGVDFPMTRGKC